MQCSHYRGPSKPTGSSGAGMAFLSPTVGEGLRPLDVWCLWEGVQLGQSKMAPLVQEQFPKSADSCGQHPQTLREPAIQFWRGNFMAQHGTHYMFLISVETRPLSLEMLLSHQVPVAMFSFDTILLTFDVWTRLRSWISLGQSINCSAPGMDTSWLKWWPSFYALCLEILRKSVLKET